MKVNSEVYKFIEVNRSLDKLISQSLEYPIKTAYNLHKAKKELDNAIDYVMERFSLICGEDVNFDSITDTENIILKQILSQEIEIEIPVIDINDIISAENVFLTVSDIENITFLFRKK